MIKLKNAIHDSTPDKVLNIVLYSSLKIHNQSLLPGMHICRSRRFSALWPVPRPFNEIELNYFSTIVLYLCPDISEQQHNTTWSRWSSTPVFWWLQRELTFTFAICHRPSVCLSSV